MRLTRRVSSSTCSAMDHAAPSTSGSSESRSSGERPGPIGPNRKSQGERSATGAECVNTTPSAIEPFDEAAAVVAQSAFDSRTSRRAGADWYLPHQVGAYESAVRIETSVSARRSVSQCCLSPSAGKSAENLGSRAMTASGSDAQNEVSLRELNIPDELNVSMFTRRQRE